MKKYYINVNDYQGGNWAMGSIGTIKSWKQRALEWCDSDENWELYRYIKRHKLDTDLIELISHYWDIDIVEFNYENVQKILDNYNREDYYWLLQDIIYKLEKGEWK